MKEKFAEKLLSQSNQFKYYKDSYEELAIKNKELKWELNRNSLYHDFDGMLARSYYNPIIESPFTKIDKDCFSFMDTIASYLRSNLNDIDEPLVSVIMPVYNRIGIVKHAIDSVLKQSYKNFELIIIDDGSTDGTVELIESMINKDDRIKFMEHEENKGVCKSRNDGLELAEGEYIFYLDSDNTWKKEYLKTMVGAYLELPDAKALYSGQYIADNYFSPIKRVRYGCFNKSLLYNRNYIDLNCFTHKKEIYNKIGGFREELKRLNDYDYILKIVDNDFKIYSIPVILSNYYLKNSHNRISDNIEYDLNKLYKPHEKYIINTDNKHLKIDYTDKFKDKFPKLKEDINIIIFTDNEIRNIEDCLEPILDYDDFEKLHIAVIYNGDNEEIKNYLNSLEDKKLIKFFNENIKYDDLTGINKIIDSFKNNKDIIFLKNDAILTKGVIESLAEYSNKLEDSGVLVTRKIALKGDKQYKIHVPYLDTRRSCDIIVSNHFKNNINMPLFYDGEYLELNFAQFFCIYIKREVYNNSIRINHEINSINSKNFYNYVKHILNKKIYFISKAIVFNKDNRILKEDIK
ncbi:MAG: glycosyltransferase family 2 protein [Methanobrevibacter sp.]